MTFVYVILGVFFIIVIVLFFLGLYFYNFSIKRKDEYKSLEQYYVNLANDKKWLYSNIMEDVSIETSDNLILRGKYLQAKEKTDKLAIIVHGYTSSGEDMAGFAHLFHEKYQCNVLLPDLRGHGESEGDYIGFGYHDSKDLIKWIEYAIKKFDENVNIILFGLSMGGATVCMASGENLPLNVKCIISDCAYDSIENILSYHMRRKFKIPKFPILHVASFMCNVKSKYKFSEGNVLNQVKKSKTPILFIHGGDDEFVPTAMVYNLYDSSACAKDIMVIEGAKHGLAYDTNPDIYNKKLEQFLNKYIVY